MKMPPFQGKNNIELFQECEKKVEHLFAWHNYAKDKKVKLIIIEFTDYALNWYDQLVIGRMRNHE